MSKTAVCFGATSGLGHHAALELARQGMSVIVVGRDKARAEAITAEAARINPKGAHKTVLVDAFSSKSIVQCCNTIKQHTNTLHYLIMSQGMATTQGYTPTAEDGFDEKLTLHFYSRMLIIECLKDLMLNTVVSAPQLDAAAPSSPPATTGVRVVSILSGGVHGPYKKIFEDPTLKNNYSTKNAADAAGYYTDLILDNYATSGRADGGLFPKKKDDGTAASSAKAEERDMLFAQRVSFIHHAPGFVATNWGTEMPWYLKGPIRGLQACFGKKAEAWAKALVEQTALSPAFAADGAKTSDGLGRLKISKQNALGLTTGPEFHTEAAKKAAFELLDTYFQKAGVGKA